MQPRQHFSHRLVNRLDDPHLRQLRDFGPVFASIALLQTQLAGGWDAAVRTRVPGAWRTVSSVLVCGMGGSALPAHILTALFSRTGLRVPLTVASGYDLPRWAGRRTLVVAASYSGGTVETLTAARAALVRGVPAVAVTSGGPLATRFRRGRKPLVVFPTDANPSGQPRLGIGYGLGSLCGILVRLRLLALSRDGFHAALAALERDRWSPAIPFSRNDAKQDAAALAGRAVLLIAPDTFLGLAHTLANQLNETAKTFAAAFALPELNHHLLEGLRFPTALRRYSSVLFLEPENRDAAMARRMAITRTIVQRQGFPIRRMQIPNRDAFNGGLLALSRGSYLSAYLARIHAVNPVRVPWVDFLKQKLAH